MSRDGREIYFQLRRSTAEDRALRRGASEKGMNRADLVRLLVLRAAGGKAKKPLVKARNSR